MLRDFGAKRALLLQGPVGPFFRRLARQLEGQGIRVTKVNFNPGDSLFFRGDGTVSYRGRLEDWPSYLRDLLEREQIDIVFLFGDCRPIHKLARKVIAEQDIPVWVFEEGYLRPDYITMELGGVNGNSSLPKDAEFYRKSVAGLPELPAPRPVGHTFGYHAVYAGLNALALTLFGWRYPHYRHHRNVNAFRQMFFWLRGFARKLWYRLRERSVIDHARGDWSHRYFFVPLQVHCDAQLEHSDYTDIGEFIGDVVASFAEHAPADTRLVIKHHPQDRAYRNYRRLIRELGAKHGCSDRLVYVHDLHLPTMLKNARGVVTMNSTVGSSALYHRTPVKVLGRAVYDIPGLTSQAELGQFFQTPGTVDTELFRCFCRWLLETNQINGSFYKRTPGIRTKSGLDEHCPLLLSDGAQVMTARRESAL